MASSAGIFGGLNVNVQALAIAAGVLVSLATLQLWRTWRRLRHIPGPFPACITEFQRVFWVTTKRAHLIHQEMHEKYGEIVRIGPNTVIFSNPEAMPTVYTTRTGFPKVCRATEKRPPNESPIPGLTEAPSPNST